MVVLQELVSKADGVPLFVEELTKTVLESGLLQEHTGHYDSQGHSQRWRFPPRCTTRW